MTNTDYHFEIANTVLNTFVKKKYGKGFKLRLSRLSIDDSRVYSLNERNYYFNKIYLIIPELITQTKIKEVEAFILKSYNDFMKCYDCSHYIRLKRIQLIIAINK